MERGGLYGPMLEIPLLPQMLRVAVPQNDAVEILVYTLAGECFLECGRLITVYHFERVE